MYLQKVCTQSTLGLMYLSLLCVRHVGLDSQLLCPCFCIHTLPWASQVEIWKTYTSWAVPQTKKIPVFVKMLLFMLLSMYNNIADLGFVVVQEGTPS